MVTIYGIKLCSQRNFDHFKIDDIIYCLEKNEIEKGYIKDKFHNSYFSAKLNNKTYAFFILSPYFILEKEFKTLIKNKKHWYSWCNQYDINIPYEKALNESGYMFVNIKKDLLI
jgi:hypothetical protein